ncbi:MAG TPA: hypothetical protein VE754_00645 [Actinomycetota bacterium]|jgi:hypothetical protein|nr:hypothetical protein [Actinomycetota bacterium]
MRRRFTLGPALVLLVSCAPAGAQPDPLAQIQAVLTARAEAMRTGDRGGFLAPVDRDDPGFVRRQGLLFDGFQKLGLADYRLDLGTTWPELTGRRERERYGEDVKVLHVEERSRIRGYDEQPSLEDLYLTFVRRGEEWRITSDSDLGDLAVLSGRRLWEFDEIVTKESRHFRYVSHPDLASSADDVLGAAERALVQVSDRWPLSWKKRIMILAPSTTEELERMIQATFDLDVFVAFAASGVDRARDWDLVGHRIMLNWDNFAVSSASSREAILVHELLHIATREDAGPMIPIFVEEGVAEWVTGGQSSALLAGRIQGGSFDRRLPLDHEFTTGSDTDIITAYQESSTAIEYAADRFGGRAVADMYDVLGEIRREPGTARFHLDRAMEAAFGIGLRRFERDWARWATRTLA